MALSFALVHWAAAAGPAASSKQAETVETTANRRVTGLAIPDTYDPATRQVNQKFGILLEARRSRSGGPQVVDAELDGDDGARVAHHRRLPAHLEERGRLPAGEALADEQGEADGHLRKAAPHAEDARGGGDGEEPASAAQQFQGDGGRRRIVGRLGVGVEGLDGDDGAQRDVEGPQQDVGDRASQRVRPLASRVRHARRGESDQEDPYRMPSRAYLHDAALPATRVNPSGSAGKACGRRPVPCVRRHRKNTRADSDLPLSAHPLSEVTNRHPQLAARDVPCTRTIAMFAAGWSATSAAHARTRPPGRSSRAAASPGVPRACPPCAARDTIGAEFDTPIGSTSPTA